MLIRIIRFLPPPVLILLALSFLMGFREYVRNVGGSITADKEQTRCGAPSFDKRQKTRQIF